MNVSHLAVRRRPRVAVLATGDELVPPGGEPAAHQIIASSVPALAAALTLWGADVVHLGLVRDDERAIAGAIQNAPARIFFSPLAAPPSATTTSSNAR